VGNVFPMPPRRAGWNRTPAQRRRTYIAEWREFRGLTQEQLAEQIDTTKATISRIESRKIGYSQDFLEVCADALGVHASVLLARAPDDTDRLGAIAARPPKTRRAAR
jgi:transcriptional regulator with XRE-family HTH domain